MLSVILANHAVKLLTSLFQDLQVEALHKVRACLQNQHIDCWLPFWLSSLEPSYQVVISCQVLTLILFSCRYLQGWEADGPPAVLSVMAQSTSIQRIQRLIDSVPLTNLLLTLLSTSYRKVGGVMPLIIWKILYNLLKMNETDCVP